MICNTSPIQYLHQLSLLHLLRTLAGQVTVPAAVADELAAGRSPGVALLDLTTSSGLPCALQRVLQCFHSILTLDFRNMEWHQSLKKTPGLVRIEPRVIHFDAEKKTIARRQIKIPRIEDRVREPWQPV